MTTTHVIRPDQSVMRESDNLSARETGRLLFSEVAPDLNSQKNTAKAAEQTKTLEGHHILPTLSFGTNSGDSSRNLKNAIGGKQDLREMKPQADIGTETSISKDIADDGKFSPASEKALQKALADGSLATLVDNVNIQLKQAKSPYRVNETEYTQSVTYEQNRGSVSLNPAPMERLNKRAEVSVFSLEQAEASHQILVKDDPLLRGYERPY